MSLGFNVQRLLLGRWQLHLQNVCYRGCNLPHIYNAQISMVRYVLPYSEERCAHLRVLR
jgi:hypothetical protein